MDVKHPGFVADFRLEGNFLEKMDWKKRVPKNCFFKKS
jgi:hypothetical protein